MHLSRGRGIGGTVRGRAVEELRSRILTGALAPGTRLDLDALTVEFGVSRTPIREALLELSYQGLVEVAPRSGITVIGLTGRELLDNFAILAALVGKAAEWAASRMSDDELACIRRLADDVTRNAEGGMGVANWRFHRAIHRAAGSPRMLTMISQAVAVVPSNFFDVFPDQGQHSVAEHDEIVAALARRDGGAARFASEHHVNEAGKALASFLENRASD